MKYPKYLSVGNWLFTHISVDKYAQHDHSVGGAIPENLYIACIDYDGIALNLSKSLRTYEGLIAYGCTEPDNKELVRLLHINL